LAQASNPPAVVVQSIAVKDFRENGASSEVAARGAGASLVILRIPWPVQS